MQAYVLQHVHTFDDDSEHVKLIGVYSSEQLAKDAIARLCVQPGFCDAPDDFEIACYSIDKDHWVTGYFSYDY